MRNDLTKIDTIFRKGRHKSNESSYKCGLKRRLEGRFGGKWFVTEAGSVRGVSDLMGCVKGLFISLEVKDHDLDLTDLTGREVLQNKIGSQVVNNEGFFAFIYPSNEDRVMESLQMHIDMRSI